MMRCIKFNALALSACLSLLALPLLSPKAAAQEDPPRPPEPWELPGTLAALEDPDPLVWAEVAKQLATYDLEAALQDPDGIQQVHIDQLVGMLSHEEATVRQQAVTLILGMEDLAEEQTPKLAELLFDEDEEVRAAAARSTNTVQYLTKDQLVELLSDSSNAVRFSAARELAAMRELSEEQLIKLLSNASEHVSFEASEVLVAMGDGAENLIPNLLSAQDASVRAVAVRSLGIMDEKAKDYAPNLLKLLADPNANVRRATVHVLGRMSDEYYPNLLQLLTDDPDDNVRRQVVFILGTTNNHAQDYAPNLVQFLADPSREVREAVVQELGRMGEPAKDQIPKLVEMLSDSNKFVRLAVIRALGEMGGIANDQAPKLRELLSDSDKDVQFAAIQALWNMGEETEDLIPKLNQMIDYSDREILSLSVQLLGDMGKGSENLVSKLGIMLSDPDTGNHWIHSEYHYLYPTVARAAAVALGKMGKAAQSQVPKLIQQLSEPVSFQGSMRDVMVDSLKRILSDEATQEDMLNILNQVNLTAYREQPEVRFVAYLFSNADPDRLFLIRYLGSPTQLPENPDYLENLTRFDEIWPLTDPDSLLQPELAQVIAWTIERGKWSAKHLDLLQRHCQHLHCHNPAQSPYRDSARVVLTAIHTVQRQQVFYWTQRGWLVHLAFWGLLIFAYPNSRPIQALFFWNPWVRRLFGLGYIGLALTWIPPLRAKLFAPFRDSLLADAKLDHIDLNTYFPDSTVNTIANRQTQPLTTAIPTLKGQIILEGSSGLGKTMFLRHLARDSKGIVVYLTADRCAQGVTEAIQQKLHGFARDPNFLRDLIYSGAIDICIDGLNEVTADTRAKISQFVEGYFKGNIIMTTQPLEWNPPTTAKIHVLQPLPQNQIEHFLISREPTLPPEAKIKGEEYEAACRAYLLQILNPQQSPHFSPEELDSARQILSNPMDLSIVAQMLAEGQTPDLLQLQQQQYTLMATEYRQIHNSDFPLDKFSEEVYQMRVDDRTAIPADRFANELQCMERHKMVTCRRSQDPEQDLNAPPVQEWHFRHDKIMEFFIVQTFLGDDNAKPEQHIADPRFRGVYFLLARLLPLEKAIALRETLIQYAADTQDHTVSDGFIKLLRPRKCETNFQVGRMAISIVH